MTVRQAAQAEAAKTGIGVSTEAQQVFDALSKTMPCHWRQQSIIILNEVMLPWAYGPILQINPGSVNTLTPEASVHHVQVELQPPYGLSNCSTENPSDLATLERVKKVVRASNLVCLDMNLHRPVEVSTNHFWHAVDS